MGKFDGLLLVSDFDDTLYDSHHRVPPRNLAAINYWLREGDGLPWPPGGPTPPLPPTST